MNRVGTKKAAKERMVRKVRRKLKPFGTYVISRVVLFVESMRFYEVNNISSSVSLQNLYLISP